jgi:hypothetical protein
VAKLSFDLELEVSKAVKENRFIDPKKQTEIVKLAGFEPDKLHYLDMRALVDAIVGLTLVPDFLEENSK